MDSPLYSPNGRIQETAEVFLYPDYYELEIEEYELPDDGFFDIVTIDEEPVEYDNDEEQNDLFKHHNSNDIVSNKKSNSCKRKNSINSHSLKKHTKMIVSSMNTDNCFSNGTCGNSPSNHDVMLRKGSRSGSMNGGAKRKAPPKPPRMSRSDSSTSSGSGGGRDSSLSISSNASSNAVNTPTQDLSLIHI